MIRHLPIFLLIVLLGGLSWGCAANRPAAGPAQSASKSYRVEDEGQVPLKEADVRTEVDHVDVFQEAPVGGGSIVVEDVEPEPVAKPDQSTPTMPGFRIQVFASGSQDAAEITRKAAADALGVPAYIDQIDGMFKVRVGNCTSRTDAEDLLQRCRRAGYNDAWIVATDVRYELRGPGESG